MKFSCIFMKRGKEHDCDTNLLKSWRRGHISHH